MVRRGRGSRPEKVHNWLDKYVPNASPAHSHTHFLIKTFTILLRKLRETFLYRHHAMKGAENDVYLNENYRVIGSKKQVKEKPLNAKIEGQDHSILINDTTIPPFSSTDEI